LSSINKIILIGTLTETPEIRLTTTGESLAKFSLSIERPGADGLSRQSDVIPVVAWRQLADSLKNHTQGQTILVEGRISTRSYEDNQGQKHYITEVEARDLKSLEANSELSSSSPSSIEPKITRSTKPKTVAPLDESSFDFNENTPFGLDKATDEEIPF
jgi:single-strand DNA-binding protein